MVQIKQGLSLFQCYSTALQISQSSFQFLIAYLQIDNFSNFFKMLHGFFPINDTSTRSNYGSLTGNPCIDVFFNLLKPIQSVFRNQFMQKFSCFFLNYKIRIYKIISKKLCQYHTCRTFSRSRHTN